MDRLVYSIRTRLEIHESFASGPAEERAKPEEQKASRPKFAAIAAKFRSKASPLPSEDLDKEIGSALSRIDVNKAQSWGAWYIGAWYINDIKSRHVFGKLREGIPVDQDQVCAILKNHLRDSDPLMQWKAMKPLTLFGERDISTFREYWERQRRWVPRELIVEALDHVAVRERIELLCEIVRFENDGGIRAHALNKLLTLQD